MKPSPGSMFLGAAVAVVVVALVAGLFALGSPMEERARRLDDRRVQDLQGIRAATDLYWTRHSALPESIGDLTDEPGVRIRAVDPVTSVPYGYERLDSARYTLCAVFEQQSGEISPDPSVTLWAHGSGRQCFRLEPERITERER